MLQSLNYLCGPSLGSLQYVHGLQDGFRPRYGSVGLQLWDILPNLVISHNLEVAFLKSITKGSQGSDNFKTEFQLLFHVCSLLCQGMFLVFIMTFFLCGECAESLGLKYVQANSIAVNF